MSTRPKTSTLRRRLAVSTLMVLGLGLIAAGAAAETGVVQGTVTDVDTGLPIEGATVLARGHHGGPNGPGHGIHHTSTGPDGGYVFDGLEAGDYRMACFKNGYFRETAETTVVADQVTVVDFALVPLAFGSVAGLVTDAVTGEPVAGARVMLLPAHKSGAEGGGHWLSAVTGEDGSYFIETVFAGDFDARAVAYGYHLAGPLPVTVVEGETSVVDFSLEPLTFGAIEGTVTDAVTGEPVAGAWVMAYRDRLEGVEIHSDGPGGGWHHVATDENGFYRFEDVIAASYRVRVFAGGYSPGEAEAEVLDGQTTFVDLVIAPLTFGSLEGTVVNADTGDPIEGARVLVFRTGSPAPSVKMQGVAPGGHGHGWHFATTDADGFYRIDEVAAGSYQVRAFAMWYFPTMAEAEIVEDETTVVDLELDPWGLGQARFD